MTKLIFPKTKKDMLSNELLLIVKAIATFAHVTIVQTDGQIEGLAIEKTDGFAIAIGRTLVKQCSSKTI